MDLSDGRRHGPPDAIFIGAGTRSSYPDGAAIREGNFVGDVIRPTPDYVKVAETYGGCSEPIQDTALLRPALQRALDAVASGKTFLLDVITLP